jgi:hypothetical protein
VDHKKYNATLDSLEDAAEKQIDSFTGPAINTDTALAIAILFGIRALRHVESIDNALYAISQSVNQLVMKP